MPSNPLAYLFSSAISVTESFQPVNVGFFMVFLAFPMGTIRILPFLSLLSKNLQYSTLVFSELCIVVFFKLFFLSATLHEHKSLIMKWHNPIHGLSLGPCRECL